MGGNPSSKDYKTLYLVYSKARQLSKHRHFAQSRQTADLQQLAKDDNPGYNEGISLGSGAWLVIEVL